MIVVLENGVVVETGRHEALLAKAGRYYDLWMLQSAEQDSDQRAQA
jgi:ATP-binding cassette subfamily B protein